MDEQNNGTNKREKLDEDNKSLKNKQCNPRYGRNKEKNVELNLTCGPEVERTDDVLIVKDNSTSNENDNNSVNVNILKENQSSNNKQLNVSRQNKRKHTTMKTCKRASKNLKKNTLADENQDQESETATLQENKNCEKLLSSLVLNKMNLNIPIDTEGACINTHSQIPPAPVQDDQFAESPESKKRRIETISKQCRLYPSNGKFNYS